MHLKRILVIFLFVGSFIVSKGQKIASFEVEIPAGNGMEFPVSINIDNITFVADSFLVLQEVNGTSLKKIPFQIKNGEHRTLFWMAPVATVKMKKSYVLSQVTTPELSNGVQLKNENGSLTFAVDSKNFLRYQFETVYPPSGVDTNYKRSGFIHPLWSPHGQELTRIQPKDHYHHYGIWNPWTHVLFENDTVDFWNIAGKTGTVRFAKFVSQSNGPLFAETEVLHEHVAFKKGTEKVAMNELQTIRVYKPQSQQDYFIVDITSKLNCATTSPVLLLAYRYGGLGWRTTEQWDNKNSEVITSSGKNRKEADGSKATWCIVQGALGENDYGGAVMLSYPANYNHPEPLRIWPENQYNRGDMFANFSPTKDKDWLIEPGKTYVLKYRLIVFNGKFTAAKAESAWQQFAKMPVVKTGSR